MKRKKVAELPADPIDSLSLTEARDRLRMIREILCPGGDPDEEWSADHFDGIARVLENLQLRVRPEEEPPAISGGEGDKRYHFSLGNSSQGPIGYCAAVQAASAKDAIEKLKNALPSEQKVDFDREENPDIEYIEAYLNPEAIAECDIDEVREIAG